MSPKLGTVRACVSGLCLALGGFMIGYDTGVVGGVLTFHSFARDFNYADASKPRVTSISSLVVGLQQVGAFLASVFISPVANRYGRRIPLFIACVVFCIGVILETVPSGQLPLFYVGRIIAGFGIGSATTLVPVYIAEISPIHLRGSLGSSIQWMFTWGVFTSYWVDYAVKQRVSDSLARQWQVPIALQMVPASILAISLLFLPESVRWLVKRGRTDEAWASLSWIRGGDTADARAEFEEIKIATTVETNSLEGFKRRELLEPRNRKRLLMAFAIFLCQQSTGATALAYFGPQVFQLVVGPGDRNLLVTGIFGFIKVLACGIFVLFVSERFGRKNFLIIGASGMALCMLTVAILDKVQPPGHGDVLPSGYAMVGLIFLNIVFYNTSWGPLPWTYVSEIFPTRTREVGVSVGMSTQWLFNLMYSLITPYMISGMGWGTFLFYAIADVITVVFVWFCLKETRGLSLEQIEHLFHTPDYKDPEERDHDGTDYAQGRDSVDKSLEDTATAEAGTQKS